MSTSEPAVASNETPPAKPSTPSRTIPKSAVELRAARRRVLIRRFGIWVGVPTLISIIYYFLIATPQYDSSLVVAVESAEGRVNVEGGKSSNAGNQRDARMLREALQGAPAFAAVDHDGSFRQHYSTHGDWFSELAADATTDTAHQYFRKKVVLGQEASTNIITVHVRAFSGEAAHDFANRLAEYSRTWVEQQNKESSTTRLQLPLSEVAKARAAFEAASRVSPEGSAAPIERQVAEKSLEVALKGLQDAQAEVGRAQRYLVVLDGPSQPDHPTLPKRVWGIVSVFVAALVMVSILSLLGASVREHAKF
jgi:capsule polysaccharide export protein KpsE/RkpR